MPTVSSGSVFPTEIQVAFHNRFRTMQYLCLARSNAHGFGSVRSKDRAWVALSFYIDGQPILRFGLARKYLAKFFAILAHPGGLQRKHAIEAGCKFQGSRIAKFLPR